MKLTYNNNTRKTSNTPGVETILPKWSDTDDMEWVDTTPFIDRLDYGEYYSDIAVALANRGYERGSTLFGAPYDFRKAPSKTDGNCYYNLNVHVSCSIFLIFVFF